MASKYEITPLNSNKTILMIVKDIEKHLHDNPFYKVYFIDASYIVGTLTYDLSDVSIPEGETITPHDIIIFNNCYYAVVDAVGTTTIVIEEAILFKGDKGDTGETGATGQTGATGNGIASIEKTGTSGNVDTYTITYTNGNTDTFTITNAPQTIGADNIDSGEATSGQILTADGSGGASWEDAQGGSGGLELVWSGELTLSGTPQSIGTFTFTNDTKYMLVFYNTSLDIRVLTSGASSGCLITASSNGIIFRTIAITTTSQIAQVSSTKIDTSSLSLSNDAFYSKLSAIYKYN